MAYDARQRQIMAYALALSGLNVAAATRWLKEHTVEVGGIGESTLRRQLRSEAFQRVVEEQAAIVAEERETAVREAERSRLKRELEGTFAEQLSTMERKAVELFDRLAGEMEKPDVDHRVLLQFWGRVQDFISKARTSTAPVIGETWQAQALIESAKVVLSRRVPELAPAILKDWLAEYQKRVTAAREERNAEAPDGAEKGG